MISLLSSSKDACVSAVGGIKPTLKSVSVFSGSTEMLWSLISVVFCRGIWLNSEAV